MQTSRFQTYGAHRMSCADAYALIGQSANHALATDWETLALAANAANHAAKTFNVQYHDGKPFNTHFYAAKSALLRMALKHAPRDCVGRHRQTVCIIVPTVMAQVSFHTVDSSAYAAPRGGAAATFWGPGAQAAAWALLRMATGHGRAGDDAQIQDVWNAQASGRLTWLRS